MRIVIAVGGKALLQHGDVLDPLGRNDKVEQLADAIAELAPEHQIVITHGYGPRIGLLSLLAETEYAQQRFPLDLLAAETEGVLGHQLEVALRNACGGRRMATLVTQVEVSADDPAFSHHTAPIGPSFTSADPTLPEVARERGWHLRVDGDRAQRMVPQPAPRRILDLDVIGELVIDGVIVTCAGGGGVPLVTGPDNRLSGVEAVVHHEQTAALLAAGLPADLLLMLTDVAYVERDWGTPSAQPIHSLVASTADPEHFIEGTMRPKVAAACRFVGETGGRAAIGSLAETVGMARGANGTQIVPELIRSVVT